MDEVKMGTQGLYVLLCTLQFLQGMQGSALLDSLTCVNNYKTHWTCNWKLSIEAHELLPMNLIYRSDLNSGGNRQCEPENSVKVKDGEVYMSCQINEWFIYAMNTTYHFEPKRDVNRDTYIIPNSNVRMPPPKELMVQTSGSNNGSLILRWRMPENVYSENLLYQVTYYRKKWESWEDAALLNVMGKTELSFSPQQFVPGSTYLFRVRCVPDKDQLYRSAWSDDIAWTMPEEVDRAVPQNLHCEYDGFTQMKCSWEVRKELSSMSYMLYYKDGARNGTTKTSTHGEKPCNNPSRQMKYGTPYVLYSCSFHIPSSQAHSSFHIQVRPQEELKIFKPFKHIQTDPPTDLKMKDPVNYKYKLGWIPPVVAYPAIKLTYQLCFWKQGDEECSDLLLVNVSGNVPEYYISSSKLSSSTNYTAKVRAKPENGSGFNGPWSDWSQSYSWKTDKAVDSVAIIVSMFFTSVGLFISAYLFFIYFKRLKQQWENSIPDPRKSKLGKSPLRYQDPHVPQFISSDFCVEVERPLVTLQISPIESPQSMCRVVEELVVEMPSESSISPLGSYSLAPPMIEKVQDLQDSCKLPETEGTIDLIGAPISQPSVNLSRMGHNSLYFIFTHAQPMSDFIGKESESSHNSTLPKCQSERFSLPKEFIPSCQTLSPGTEMSYVLNMETQPPLQTPPKVNSYEHESKKSGYFTIPPPADVQVSQEGPLMIINPDGTGPLVLKQVGDYCFFPGVRGSQENLEKKVVPANAKMPPQASKDSALPAVQVFKMMQGDYLALPQN
ncbi:cytokine receptor common subunit beta isoform X1 [Ranitomeya variabilis]|uniref:cytokine receptor common subunit beta isoform X1 n=2 Tax=Ranitomeya variabilis TaxID=490064 RepID=UPI004055C400